MSKTAKDMTVSTVFASSFFKMCVHYLAKKREEEDEDDMADLQAWATS